MEAEEVAEAGEVEEVTAPATLGWTQVHPSRVAVPVGLAPHSLGNEWHCHCSHSCHSQRWAHLQAEKNQQSGDRDDSVPGVTKVSLWPLVIPVH